MFILSVDAALDTAASSSVLLINGTQASRIFWQVLGAAGTGGSSAFVGTVLAEGAITVGNLAVAQGAALLRGGVMLSDNTITTPVVTGGLSISVSSDAVPLRSRSNTLQGGVVSDSLGVVQVRRAQPRCGFWLGRERGLHRLHRVWRSDTCQGSQVLGRDDHQGRHRDLCVE